MVDVLILGSSGFVGSSLAASLAQDFSLGGVSRSCGAETQVIADLTEDPSWKGLPKSADVIVNAAAIVGRQQEATDRQYLLANAYIPHKAARYAREIGAFLIQLSTTGVYGFRREPVTEETPIDPQDTYNATKYQGEIACSSLLPADRLSVLRISFPYGPKQRRGLIPTLIPRVRSGDAITLNTVDGKPRITPLFIDDCCAAIRKIIENRLHGIFNCAGNENVSIIELGELIGLELGVSPVFANGGTPCENLLADASRLRQASDWETTYSLREGLHRTVATIKEEEI